MVNKESTITKTYLLTSLFVNKLNNIEKLRFYIKDDNFLKFKEVFKKSEKNNLIEEKDIKGNTLLNLAVQFNTSSIAEFLIMEGSDINTQNEEMNSPLHYALKHNNYFLSNLLITNKADEYLVNIKGLTPWQMSTIDLKN